MLRVFEEVLGRKAFVIVVMLFVMACFGKPCVVM